eukprot:TRINITY_DN2542_c0_g1_i1.p1 TRINITY_DN2542_c0_g1~~TRINITY_DN2542_c0_g1_i1.p1  ORF type:complete len:344 (+),score=35.54 TRINITY_DN2542_c0_g1_i1:52-1032(+)
MLKLLFLLASFCCVSALVEGIEGCGTRQVTVLRERKIYYTVPCAKGTFPIMVALHGLGSNGEVELLRYTDLAEQAMFILVAPDGVWGSYNAPECCGKARKRQLDEKKFFLDTIATIASITKVHSGKTVVTGFSNGAFLSMELARTTAVNLVAAAAMSGYNYGNNIQRSLPVLLHHSLDDGMVLSTGCCSGSRCAFGLDVNPQCVPTITWHSRWAAKNHCSAKKVLKHEFFPDNIDEAFECYRHDCKQATILCHHKNTRHLGWASHSIKFRVETHIVNFFKDEICKASGGLVLPPTKKLPKRCKCLNRAQGLYCSFHPDGPHMNFRK